MEKITCDIKYDHKVNFALQQSHIPVIKSLSIQNKTESKLSNLKITIQSDPYFSHPYQLHIENLPESETIELKPELLLSTSFLSQLEESISGQLHIQIFENDLTIYSDQIKIDILSFDCWPGGAILPEIISSFITPNRPFILEIIKKSASILEKNTGSTAFDGYQSGDPNRVIAQLASIFTSIQSFGISYINPPASFEENGQKIRFPDLIQQHRLGTCLDLTLLYAACAEAIGIHPIIIFLRGHAFPGFWLKDFALSESYQDDQSIITKHLADGINEILIIESTLLTNSQSSFQSAILKAKEQLNEPNSFQYFIDVYRSRIGQIKPLAIQVNNDTQLKVSEVEDTLVRFNEKLSFEQVQIIPESEQTAQEHNKVLYWQNKLIDMSLRNNLLNYRFTNRGIPIVTANLSQTEDLLAMGQKVFIKPVPSEWKQYVRDFSSSESLVHSQIIQEDMKNNRIRSTLTDIGLEKELVKLYRNAKNTLEESGANSLFVALGFLKWFDDKSYTKERFSPILLMPVNLVRVSAKKGYYVQARDEEVQINISLIEFLNQKFGINASRLYDIPKDDHGADVKKIMTTLRRLIMPMDRWDILEQASIGLFSFSKFVMWNDLVHLAEKLKENQVVKSLIDGTYPGEVKDSNLSSLTAEKEAEAISYIPLSSDSTQTEAILAMEDNNSFVLHGPPGSGKSQTITNMITHALGSGKTVLFVAEKMAALNVVQKRLADIGLGDFCLEIYSNKGQKKDILAQLEATIEKQAQTKETPWSEKTNELVQLKQVLNAYVLELHQKTNLNQSIFEMIESYSAIVTNNAELSLDREAVKLTDAAQLTKTKELLKQIEITASSCTAPSGNPWKGMNVTQYSLKLQDELLESLKIIQQEGTRFENIDKKLGQLGFICSKKDKKWYQFIHSTLPLFQNSKYGNRDLLADPNFNSITATVKATIQKGQACDESRKMVSKNFDLSILKKDIEPLLQKIRSANNSWILKKKLLIRSIKQELKKYVTSKVKLSDKELEKSLQVIKDFQDNQLVINQQAQKMESLFPSLWNSDSIQWTAMMEFIEGLEEIKNHSEALKLQEQDWITLIKQIEGQRDYFFSNEGVKFQQEFIQSFELFDPQWQTINRLLETNDFEESSQDEWFSFMTGKVGRLINVLPTLKDNCLLTTALEQANQAGLSQVTSAYLSGKLQHDELVTCYLYQFYRIRIDEEISKSRYLVQFSKSSFEHKLEKFNHLDDELSELTKLEVYIKLMNTIPTIHQTSIQSSEPGILLRAIKSKGRGMSIRQLFERIQKLLFKLKPCMLMSPLSVAQYLDPTFPKFDYVIFDEASQLPTSEAIGAMARGRNVIVVGDPKQLPPTSFFNSQQNEESFELSDMESILDDCLSIQMPQKHLRWHYRSEHESLISFSNNHFYENKLVTFPSTDDSVSRVSFRNVNGIYDRGKTKKNHIEAEAIVTELFNRLKEPIKQQESVGIVTFSQVQQTLIEDLIDERLMNEPECERFFSDETTEPVFVKNLENVQGDERDLILFSIGYGPDSTGQITLNFGPLNRDGGWRRLNVAVSRAKKEMIIFASMEPEGINLSRTKAEGIHSLRSFMEFAKKGNEPLLLENRRSVIRPNSEIIIPQIKAFIKSHGFKVKENIGSSEYKIDLAVVHPDKEQEYCAAIQVDGHQYARRITPRDRHKLSTSMLNKLGWYTIHVWSIDWWHNKEQQLQQIIDQINEYLQKNNQQTNRLLSNQVNKVIPFEEKISHFLLQKEQTEDTLLHTKTIYQSTQLEKPPYDNQMFYSIEGAPVIQAQLRELIQKESPISLTQITRAIASSWKFTRAGAKIESVIKNQLKQLPYYQTTDSKGCFLWESRQQYEQFIDFRTYSELNEDSKRRLQDISKEELANGIQQLIQSTLSLPNEILNREIIKQLGYVRTSPAIEAYMEEALQLAKAKNWVDINEDNVGFITVVTV
ncbi:DUF3320 domain-containing protein [Alkalihalobacillus pseudalcaliphilus]|uniref:DUF3320 domain-containing protein n=1 Tax=Alkalihalobacillus pseudalcaliphilus TaxID=79884 RepID=UPI00064DC2E4|nr:DUF3320 domain-containing protein [Alkalihalobacillus pseudalcaliphilus]KMK75186.1 hypothetical protein AB990_17265 [Alkalihalobacillus pseudalcaliphilus]